MLLHLLSGLLWKSGLSGSVWEFFYAVPVIAYIYFL